MNIKEFITLLGFDVDVDALGPYDAALDRTFKKVEDMDRGFKKLADGMVNIGTKMSLFLTTPILGFSTASVLARNKLEDWQKEWYALLGSEADAKKFIDTVFKMEDKQPFEVGQILEYMKALKGLGVSDNRLIGKFRTYSDIAAGRGLSVDYLMNYASQMRNMAEEMGYVQGRFILQLVKHGALSGKDIQKFFGFSGTGKLPGIIKMTGGQVDALFDMMGKKYEGRAAIKADTLNKKIHILGDAIMRLMAKIGDVLYRKLRLNAVFTTLISLVERATEVIGKMDNRVVNWTIAIAALLAVIGPLTLALGGLMKGFIAFRGAMVMFGATGAAATGWIALITAGILGLLLLIDDLYFWIKKGPEHSFYGGAITKLVDMVSKWGEDIYLWATAIIDKVINYFKEQWMLVKNWFAGIWGGDNTKQYAGRHNKINDWLLGLLGGEENYNKQNKAWHTNILDMFKGPSPAAAGVAIGNINVTIPNADKETINYVTKAVKQSATTAYDEFLKGITNSVYNQVKR